jgi:hypothetical protein
MPVQNTVEATVPNASAKRPVYEKPRVQVMSEREILNTFQITQAMATWWAAC